MGGGVKLSPFSGKDRCLTMAVKVAENKGKKYRNVLLTTNKSRGEY